MPEVAVPDDDLARLLQNAGDAVLVGGQALAFWISYYKAPMQDAPGPARPPGVRPVRPDDERE